MWIIVSSVGVLSDKSNGRVKEKMLLQAKLKYCPSMLRMKYQKNTKASYQHHVV